MEDRTLLTTRRVRGTVLEWTGGNGWIAPEEKFDHSLWTEQKGRLYLAIEDLQCPENPLSAGMAVTFFVYTDSSVLGAMDVRTAVAAGSGLPLQRALCDDAPVDKMVKREDVPITGLPPPPPAPRERQFARARGGPRRDKIEPEEALNLSHHTFYSGIWDASRQLDHPDVQGSHVELATRLTRYFHKAAQSPEMLELPWTEAARQFIDHAMLGYSASCGHTAWFFELDLAPALSAGVWELLQASAVPGCSRRVLERALVDQYEQVMENLLVDKAMWDATKSIFKEAPCQSKMYKALHSSHENALTAAFASDVRLKPRERVEFFMREWMERSVNKAWQSLDGAESLLGIATVVSLFELLVAPFGDDHPFSCVPASLTEAIGRPPQDWPFLRRTAEAVVKSWTHAVSSSKKKKRRSSV